LSALNISNLKQTRGFTLIEVLVAFVILAVGLLAIVNLQAMSKQFTHQAMQRSLAVSYGDSIVERIRANPAGLLTYSGAAVVGGDAIADEPAPNCIDTACTPTELASHDLWAWEERLDGAAATVVDAGATVNATGLIDARACMTFTPRAGLARTGFLTVRIQWTGLHSISDSVTVAGTNCNAAVAANTDRFRRQVVVNTYLVDEAEL